MRARASLCFVARAATVVAGAVGVCVGAGGCWSYRNGDHYRTSPAVSALPSDAWPTRDMKAMAQLRDATPATTPAINSVGFSRILDDKAPTPRIRRAQEGVELAVSHNQLHGQGLLRLYEPMSADPQRAEDFRREDAESIGFAPDGRFVTSRILNDPRVRVEEARRERLTAAVRELEQIPLSANTSVRAVAKVDASLLQHGMAVQMPRHFETLPKGLIVHLHSLAPNPFEPKVAATFDRHGWAVVTLNTSTGVRPPFTDEQIARIEQIETARTDEIANRLNHWASVLGKEDFAEGVTRPSYASFYRPTVRPKSKMETLNSEMRRLMDDVCYRCESDESIDTIATTIARETDEALASNAYGVEAVLDYINKHRPDVSPKAHNLPVVVVGFSAGALAAPASAVRVRDQIDAVVLIGGGADLFRISQESTLTDGGIGLRKGKSRAPRAIRDKIDALYLQRVRLDPYHTAPLLAGLPLLQVHAGWDKWVPDECGELLWERSGRPDKLTLAGGHSLLFLMLPGKGEWIINWIEQNTLETRRDAAMSRN